MAVATSMAVMGGLGLAKGLYDTVSGSQKEKARQAELDAYQRKELTNAYKDMQISTIGSDAMREESSRNIATAMNTIGNSGTRSIIGATPKLVAEQNNVNKNIQKELDDQVQKRNYAIAGDDAQIRSMQEQRENADLAGLGNAIDAARQDKNMGMNTMLNSIGAVASTATANTSVERPQVEGVSSITPAGLAKFPAQTIGLQPTINSDSNNNRLNSYGNGIFDNPNSDMIDKYGRRKINYQF